jgi:hypothetical protein
VSIAVAFRAANAPVATLAGMKHDTAGSGAGADRADADESVRGRAARRREEGAVLPTTTRDETDLASERADNVLAA